MSLSPGHQQIIIVASPDSPGSVALENAADEVRAMGLTVTMTVAAEVFDQLERVEIAGEPIAVVVFGPGIAGVMALARRIRVQWRLTRFIFAPDALELGKFKRELSRAPMIGSNWSIVDPESSAVPTLIVESAQMSRRRVQLRTTLDRANVRIGTPKPVDSHDYRRLVLSDHYLKNLLAQAHDAIVSLDSTDRVLYWSEGAQRLFGVGAEQAVGQPVARLPFWTETLAGHLDEVRSLDEAITTEANISTSSGFAQVEIAISSVREEMGTLIGSSLFMRDVTERNQALKAEREARQKAESAIKEKEQQRRLFESMLTSTADQSYVFDLDGRLQYANRAFSEQLEVEPATLPGKTAPELGFTTEKGKQITDHVREVAASRQPVRAEVPFTGPSGRGWIFEYILVPVVDEWGQVEAIAGTSRDITERKKASDRIWREANYDSLTNLPNRRLFRDRLNFEVKHAQRNGTSIALFFLDLDRFKEVNDLYGHGAGDELLSQAAARIRSSIRESDTVARLGGDEFTVILTELDDAAHVETTAQKILDELARPFKVHGSVCYLSGSIGITLYPLDAVEPADLIRNADQAMYIAKNNGRSQFSFFRRIFQEAALSRLRLQADLRHALAGNQLRLCFQPIVRLADSRIVKAEALIRWEHPTRGLLLPEEFITLAEETGQIKLLGNWVFSEAAIFSRKWSRLLGRTFQISINKSPVQFEDRGHSMDWAAHLKQMGLPGNSISVEITEGVILNATPTTSDKLLELQSAGIELSIDDFGTGYSSMAYLKKFDVDYLKIDQSFVQDMASNASSRTIAESIIVMGHKLGLKIVAEGVETEDQRLWLRSVGCDYAQGFLFSRPVSADQFEELLRDQINPPTGTL
ncbi:putative bifunctional diguanylate cyclase/phosphodiesterase [Marinobacter salicampi]|uniref:putative bifunctional diguanylate cyclase/phosphodiesterase n=1 Tax=Marinobacter salicampi TaxID=435907 RepID=UPI0014073E70|nr:bifunctional diguanylate cyclase/phosphodiesterase [Marinobacter salicampi]